MGTDFLVNIKILLHSQHISTVLSELCLASTIIFIFQTISLNTEHILAVLSELCSVFTEIVLKKTNTTHNVYSKHLHIYYECSEK